MRKMLAYCSCVQPSRTVSAPRRCPRHVLACACACHACAGKLQTHLGHLSTAASCMDCMTACPACCTAQTWRCMVLPGATPVTACAGMAMLCWCFLQCHASGGKDADVATVLCCAVSAAMRMNIILCCGCNCLCRTAIERCAACVCMQGAAAHNPHVAAVLEPELQSSLQDLCAAAETRDS